MIFLALALAAALPADTAGTAEDSPAARGVSVVVHRQPAVPLVALRVSVLADDPAGYAGVGHMLQHVLLPTLERQVGRVGGRVQLVRNSDALVYTVVGPANELNYLAGVLRSVLRLRAIEVAEILQARYELDEERRAEWERAESHVRSALRAAMFPQDLSAAGTPGSASRIDAGILLAAWSAMYRPERVSVVAVGDVVPAAVEEAFREMAPLLGKAQGETELDPEAMDTAAAAPIATVQATRSWFGLGYRLEEVDPAAVSATARLLQQHLRQRFPKAEITAEHWWTHHGQAVVIAAATPERNPAVLADPFRAAIEEFGADLDNAQVRKATAQLQHEMLYASRTPDRMADLIGTFVDRGGEPNSAQQFYARLERLGARDIRRVLNALVARPPEQVSVPAQVLTPRT